MVLARWSDVCSSVDKHGNSIMQQFPEKHQNNLPSFVVLIKHCHMVKHSSHVLDVMSTDFNLLNENEML